VSLGDVLWQYPGLLGAGSAQIVDGGFRGARLWRLEASAGDFCCRAWPSDMTEERLAFIHGLLQRARHLPYVPRLVPTRTGSSWVEHEGCYWEITTWLPGSADCQQAPSKQRMAAACLALAQLHQAWSDHYGHAAICPAVQRRLATVHEWEQLLQQGFQPTWSENHALAALSRRAWLVVQARYAGLAPLLRPWLARPVPIQPCLCDIWRAHVLYTGDVVTGIIDYGSAKLDHIAVDLARLLGDLAGNDLELRQAGLEAYARLRPLADWEHQLVDVLDSTGTVIAALNWLRWLYHDHRVYPNRDAVAERLERIVRRLTGD
jgi:Ser/Thr protein kinase RdoA (MazF antagonist)